MKIKQKVNKALLGATIFMLSVPCFATGVDTVTIMETGMTSAKTDILGMVAVALPIGLGLVATFLGIKKGVTFFKTLVNKA